MAQPCTCFFVKMKLVKVKHLRLQSTETKIKECINFLFYFGKHSKMICFTIEYF